MVKGFNPAKREENQSNPNWGCSCYCVAAQASPTEASTQAPNSSPLLFSRQATVEPCLWPKPQSSDLALSLTPSSPIAHVGLVNRGPALPPRTQPSSLLLFFLLLGLA